MSEDIEAIDDVEISLKHCEGFLQTLLKIVPELPDHNMQGGGLELCRMFRVELIHLNTIAPDGINDPALMKIAELGGDLYPRWCAAQEQVLGSQERQWHTDALLRVVNWIDEAIKAFTRDYAEQRRASLT